MELLAVDPKRLEGPDVVPELLQRPHRLLDHALMGGKVGVRLPHRERHPADPDARGERPVPDASSRRQRLRDERLPVRGAPDPVEALNELELVQYPLARVGHADCERPLEEVHPGTVVASLHGVAARGREKAGRALTE